MLYLLVRDRISRSQFLLRTGGAIGTLLFGVALGSASAKAQETAAASFSKNITGVYVPEGTRHLVTSDKPEENSWGFLPNRDTEPILTVESGDVVTMEQISHEGILDDQGDPVSFSRATTSPRRRFWTTSSWSTRRSSTRARAHTSVPAP